MLVERRLPRPFSLRRLCFSHRFKQLLWEITMKTRIALFALTLAALPFAAQSASAQGYYDRDEARIARDNHRIWHERADIAHDWRALSRERAERNDAAFRERQALWHGNFGAARYFDWRRRHEQAEINAERRTSPATASISLTSGSSATSTSRIAITTKAAIAK